MCYMLVVKRWKMGKIYSTYIDVCASHCCSYASAWHGTLYSLLFVCLSVCWLACLLAYLFASVPACLPTRLPTVYKVYMLFGSGILSMRRHFRLFTHNYAVYAYLLSACMRCKVELWVRQAARVRTGKSFFLLVRVHIHIIRREIANCGHITSKQSDRRIIKEQSYHIELCF